MSTKHDTAARIQYTLILKQIPKFIKDKGYAFSCTMVDVWSAIAAGHIPVLRRKDGTNGDVVRCADVVEWANLMQAEHVDRNLKDDPA